MFPPLRQTLRVVPVIPSRGGSARHAYSHSASVGSRYFFPSFLLNHSQNATASFQLTFTTGCLSVCSKPAFRQVYSAFCSHPSASVYPTAPCPSFSRVGPVVRLADELPKLAARDMVLT